MALPPFELSFCDCPMCVAIRADRTQEAQSAEVLRDEEADWGVEIAAEALNELDRVSALFSAFKSPHKGFAVLLEEVDELWAEVKRSPTTQNMKQMRTEAVQVAAMALRFIRDCCDE